MPKRSIFQNELSLLFRHPIERARCDDVTAYFHVAFCSCDVFSDISIQISSSDKADCDVGNGLNCSRKLCQCSTGKY